MPTVELTEKQLRDVLSLIYFELAVGHIKALETKKIRGRNLHRRLEALATKLEEIINA